MSSGLLTVEPVRAYNKAYAKYVPLKWQSYTEEYGNVYSSRTVIKNQFINQDVTGGYYKTDVWAEYNELLKDIIPQGMSVYGEIVGYITGAQTMIQKKFDYGCEEGTNKLMIYRINTENEDGTHVHIEAYKNDKAINPLSLLE